MQCAWQYKCPKILVRWMAEHWQSSFSYQLAFHFHLHFIFIFISICISHFILLVPQVHRTESWLCRASSMMEQVASRVGPWHELGAFLLSKPTGLSLRRRARKGQTALRSHMPQHYSDYWATKDSPAYSPANSPACASDTRTDGREVHTRTRSMQPDGA